MSIEILTFFKDFTSFLGAGEYEVIFRVGTYKNERSFFPFVKTKSETKLNISTQFFPYSFFSILAKPNCQNPFRNMGLYASKPRSVKDLYAVMYLVDLLV